MKLKLLAGIALLIIFTFLFNSPLGSAGNSCVQNGEVLEYEISYMGVSLAKVKVVTNGNEKVFGRPRHVAKAYINTYSHVPMVDVNAILQTWFDPAYGYSAKYSRNLKLSDKPREYQELLFDYQDGRISNKKWVKKKLVHSSGIKINKKQRLSDPLGLFFKARELSTRRQKKSIYTVFERNPFYVSLNITGKKKKMEVDALGGMIKVAQIKAHANWESGYGLTGNIEGWVTADKAAVPVIAEIDFYIGKITVELVKASRPGWKAPR